MFSIEALPHEFYIYIQRINMKVKVGIDIGSTTVKVVVLDENDKSLYVSFPFSS